MDISDLDAAATRRLVAAYRDAHNVRALAGLADMLADRAAAGIETQAQLDAARHTIGHLRTELAPYREARAALANYTVDSRHDIADAYDDLFHAYVATAIDLGQRHDYDPATDRHLPVCAACQLLADIPAEVTAEALTAAARAATPPIPGEVP